MWFVFALLAGFLFAVDRLILRSVFAKKTDPLGFGAVHELLSCLFLIPIALLNFTIPQTTILWIYLLLVGIFVFLADLTSFLSLENTEASVYQIAQQSRHAVILIGAYIVFGEAITISKIISVSLIIVGVLVALVDLSKFKFTKGVIYASLSAIFISGAFLVIKKIGSQTSPAFTGAFGFFISGFLMYFIFILRGGKAGKIISKGNRKQLLLGSLIFSLFELCLFTSLTLGEASRVTPVTQSSLVFTLLGGYIFLNEKLRLREKIIGSCLIAIGIIMLYFI